MLENINTHHGIDNPICGLKTEQIVTYPDSQSSPLLSFNQREASNLRGNIHHIERTVKNRSASCWIPLQSPILDPEACNQRTVGETYNACRMGAPWRPGHTDIEISTIENNAPI